MIEEPDVHSFLGVVDDFIEKGLTFALAMELTMLIQKQCSVALSKQEKKRFLELSALCK